MLSAALDEVLTIPGQRFGFTLSMCHEIITMKCDEVRDTHYCTGVKLIISHRNLSTILSISLVSGPKY
jgi:hypothetical protein